MIEERRVIELAKQYVAAADAAANIGDWASAVERMDEALQLRPAFVPYWVSKGHFLRQWLKFGRAEDAIRKAIAINPRACYAWSELGLLFKDRRLFKEAADCLSQSVQLRPDFATYTVLADVELSFDPSAALRDAEKALELNPSWEEAERIRDIALRRIEE